MDLVSGQWTLNETATCLTDLIRASTSDDVQSSALVIAESFGRTLTISHATRSKVEEVARLHHWSPTIKFLKGKIGYARGDCSDYLASSDGGVRFLSLASALLCTNTSIIAATILHTMILKGAPARHANDLVIPTVKQLQKLLDAIEHKLCRAGFALYVSAWQKLLRELCPDRNDGQHPEQKLIEALVDAYRVIEHAGPRDVVEIRASSGLPWIIALTTWCLGSAPSVTTADGTTLVEGTNPKVMLYINDNASDPQEVRMIHEIESPDVLWLGPMQSHENRAWTGMVSIASYGEQHLASLGLASPQARHALQEATLFTVPRVVGNLWPMVTAEQGTPFHPALANPNSQHGPAQSEFIQYRSHMFGSEHQLKSVLTQYTSMTNDQVMPWCVGGQLQHCPGLEHYLEYLVSTCGCSICSHTTSNYNETNPPWLKSQEPESLLDTISLSTPVRGKAAQIRDVGSRCAVIRFWSHVSTVTAEILALSLYDCMEPIQVFWPGGNATSARVEGRFTNSVHECIFKQSSSPTFCRIEYLLQLATSLLGHKVSEEVEHGIWAASAFRGQVIYPVLFDLVKLDTHPLLIGGGPGQLVLGDLKPEKVVSRNPSAITKTSFPAIPTSKVDQVMNLFPSDKLCWHVSPTVADPELFCSTTNSQKISNPNRVLGACSRSLFVSCSHPKDACLPAPADDCIFTTVPFFHSTNNPRNFDSVSSMSKYIHMRNVQNNTKTFKIQVLPTAGNDGLRLFAMCSPWPGVVRDKACLQCCIEVCRKSGLEYIVL